MKTLLPALVLVGACSSAPPAVNNGYKLNGAAGRRPSGPSARAHGTMLQRD